MVNISSLYQPPAIAMTDPARGGDPIQMASKVPSGGILIFRHYGVKNRPALAQKVLKACRKHSVNCVIAGDIRLALALKADGIHFPEYILKKMGSRPKVPSHMILTGAVHSLAMALKAKQVGLHAGILSPVYSSESHSDTIPLGILRVAIIAKATKIPIIALGGIKPENIRKLKNTGVIAVAGIGLFTDYPKSPHNRNVKGIGNLKNKIRALAFEP